MNVCNVQKNLGISHYLRIFREYLWECLGNEKLISRTSGGLYLSSTSNDQPKVRLILYLFLLRKIKRFIEIPRYPSEEIVLKIYEWRSCIEENKLWCVIMTVVNRKVFLLENPGSWKLQWENKNYDWSFSVRVCLTF